MAEYLIYEKNIDKVRKEKDKIAKKCKKAGIKFEYKELGDEFKTYLCSDGMYHTFRFIKVFMDGDLVVNDWEFVACMEHVKEKKDGKEVDKGNYIKPSIHTRKAKIPQKYYYSSNECEHCHVKQPNRKYLDLIRNVKTGEFKQVGSSCLLDYTGGMTEAMANYLTNLDESIQEEQDSFQKKVQDKDEFNRMRNDFVYPTKVIMLYVEEVVRTYGYVKKGYGNASGDLAMNYYEHDRNKQKYGIDSSVIYPANYKLINVLSKEAKQNVEGALKWLDEQKETNEYIHNLKLIKSIKNIKREYVYIIASLFNEYNKYVTKKKREERKRKEEEEIMRRREEEAKKKAIKDAAIKVGVDKWIKEHKDIIEKDAKSEWGHNCKKDHVCVKMAEITGEKDNYQTNLDNTKYYTDTDITFYDENGNKYVAKMDRGDYGFKNGSEFKKLEGKYLYGWKRDKEYPYREKIEYVIKNKDDKNEIHYEDVTLDIPSVKVTTVRYGDVINTDLFNLQQIKPDSKDIYVDSWNSYTESDTVSMTIHKFTNDDVYIKLIGKDGIEYNIDKNGNSIWKEIGIDFNHVNGRVRYAEDGVVYLDTLDSILSKVDENGNISNVTGNIIKYRKNNEGGTSICGIMKCEGTYQEEDNSKYHVENNIKDIVVDSIDSYKKGDKVSMTLKSFEMTRTGDGQFGKYYVYQMRGVDGILYEWWTGAKFRTDSVYNHVVGIVKAVETDWKTREKKVKLRNCKLSVVDSDIEEDE